MTPKETLVAILKTNNVPVDLILNTDEVKPNTYITYQFYDEYGKDFADDEETATAFLIQVNIFSKGSFTALAQKVKDDLKAAGFARTTENETYEPDTKLFHKILRFYYSIEN